MTESGLFKRLLAPLVLLVIAYEWLVSGFDKVLSGNFAGDLGHEMSSALGNMQYTFYASLLKHLVLPHAALFGVVVEAAELIAGLALVYVAIALFRNKVTRVTLHVGAWVSVLSALMVLNFFFYQGGSMFVNTSDPFDEGIPIDFVLFLMQALISVSFFAGLRELRVLQRVEAPKPAAIRSFHLDSPARGTQPLRSVSARNRLGSR